MAATNSPGAASPSMAATARRIATARLTPSCAAQALLLVHLGGAQP